MPVIKNAHQAQFWLTPLVRTISVTRFGVSVENVVATMDMPSIHQGMVRPDRKNSLVFLPARRDTHAPMPSERAKKPKMIDQSRVVICRASVSGRVGRERRAGSLPARGCVGGLARSNLFAVHSGGEEEEQQQAEDDQECQGDLHVMNSQ